MCAFMGVAATFVSSTLVKQFGILKVSLAFHFFSKVPHKYENLLCVNDSIGNTLFSRRGQLGWCFKLYFSAWLLQYI
jgi:hypothetical protein